MSDELKPVYLITGGDRPKVERAVERLRAASTPRPSSTSGPRRRAATRPSPRATPSGCSATGRLVLVTEVDGHRNRDDRMAGGWKAADVKAVVDYLKSPTPDTVLALVGEEVKKDSPLGKACAKAGDVLVYEAEKRNLTAWVARSSPARRRSPRRAGCWSSSSARTPSSCGSRSTSSPSGRTATRSPPSDVEALVAPRGPVKPWTLTDAWGEHDMTGVLDACDRMLAEAATPSGLVVAARRPCRARAACRDFAADGVPPGRGGEAAEASSEFPVRKAFGQAEHCDLDELRSATVRLADLDPAVKGGAGCRTSSSSTRTLVDVTRPRRRESAELARRTPETSRAA